MARVAILKPNDKDINSVEGGWLGFHVIVVPVVKKMKKKVASSSTKALAQKWTLLSSDTNIILGVLVLASSPQYSLCGIEIVWHSPVVYTTSFEAGAICHGNVEALIGCSKALREMIAIKVHVIKANHAERLVSKPVVHQ